MPTVKEITQTLSPNGTEILPGPARIFVAIRQMLEWMAEREGSEAKKLWPPPHKYIQRPTAPGSVTPTKCAFPECDLPINAPVHFDPKLVGYISKYSGKMLEVTGGLGKTITFYDRNRIEKTLEIATLTSGGDGTIVEVEKALGELAASKIYPTKIDFGIWFDTATERVKEGTRTAAGICTPSPVDIGGFWYLWRQEHKDNPDYYEPIPIDRWTASGIKAFAIAFEQESVKQRVAILGIEMQ